MLIKEYEGHKPNLHPTVRVAENATIVGKATLAEDVNVWYSAVIRADGDVLEKRRVRRVVELGHVHVADADLQRAHGL